jgi:hypothetical protein
MSVVRGCVSRKDERIYAVIWTAVQIGITDQQIANDPGGQRWSSRLDRAIDMFLAFVRARPPRKKA